MGCSRRIALCCILATVLCAGASRASELYEPRLSTTLALDYAKQDPIDGPIFAPYLVSRNRFVSGGMVHDAASTPDASGSLTAGLGYFKVTGHSTTSSPCESGLYGDTYFSVNAQDNVRIMPTDPRLLGQPGRLVANIDIRATGAANVTADWPATRDYTYASYHVYFTVSSTFSPIWQGGWTPDDGTGTSFRGDLGRKTLDVSFTFGEPFNLYSQSWMATDTGGGYLILPGNASASLDLEMQWMGFASVEDASGNPVVGYTVVSASGIDWSQPAPVPEPTGACVFAGAFLLVRRRRTTPRPIG